jgi:hypothetical protein
MSTTFDSARVAELAGQVSDPSSPQRIWATTRPAPFTMASSTAGPR